jgi:3-hydroxyisobutyrate dehydrogenase-like beta-hydroxyacid dehydrogenase
MSDAVRICLIGFGEVGRTLAADLRAHGVNDIRAWDVQFANPDSAQTRAARESRVEVASSPASAVAEASLIISAVTAAQDTAAAQSVAAHLADGALFVDVNSVSPMVKQQTAAVIEAGRGHYVEAAIMAPIAPRRIASPILLGGPHAARFAALARPLGFTGTEVFSPVIGQASAAKMCRSVIIKGMEALLTESLLAARRHGVHETVIQSLQNLLPGSDWHSLARYMISRSLQHGARRAEEMREVAVTVRESGLHPWMSEATVERQQWAAPFGELANIADLESLLDRLLSAAAEK